MLKLFRLTAVLALACIQVRGQSAPKTVIYNNLEGDGSQELDHSIKQTYSGRYDIRDTRAGEGYAEPSPISGTMPGEQKDDKGTPLAGYVLVAYIVGIDGLVCDPVVLKTSDERLSKIALEAMAHWKFRAGKVNGLEVATTAAQEFRFGPVRFASGFTLKHLALYQPNDVITRRMPAKDVADRYLDRLTEIAHNFFIGNPPAETLHIIVLLMPGGRSRVWFLSSNRPGNSNELLPLKHLLEAERPLSVNQGPVLFALSGVVMGGDGQDLPAGQLPVPAEWQEVESRHKDVVPITGDEFLTLAFRESP